MRAVEHNTTDAGAGRRLVEIRGQGVWHSFLQPTPHG
jgi:hypothetical protein